LQDPLKELWGALTADFLATGRRARRLAEEAKKEEHLLEHPRQRGEDHLLEPCPSTRRCGPASSRLAGPKSARIPPAPTSIR
jgi:hypothetical protein